MIASIMKRLASVFLLLTSFNCSIAADQPNVILIYADDLGWAGLGCYGNEYHETPNIDALCSRGMKFTSAYSGGPVCAPSRACLLSGQYVTKHGIYRVNQVDAKYPQARKLIPPKNETDLTREVATIADGFKSAGYVTGYCGKWHLGYDEGYLPSDRGFTDAMTTRSPSGDERYFFPNFSTIPKTKIEDDTYLTEFITDWGCEFLDRNKEKPFFLYLPHLNVHGPHEARADKIAKYRKKDPKRKPIEAVYAAMHEHLDDGVGKLLDTLDRLSLRDNTIVIFTSDNGNLSGFDKASPLRGGKSYLYEGGIRIPLFIDWPGVTKAGSQSDVPVHQVDLYPTLLNLVGGELPTQTLDGKDLGSLIRNPDEQTLAERPLFWHYPTYMKYSKKTKKYAVTPCSVVRQGKWKLVDYFTGEQSESVQLFDLENDMGEKHNLAVSSPDKAKELRGKLQDWRDETNAMMPVLESESVGRENAKSDPSNKNVLFIAIDDLRPDLGCYGNSVVKTPNLDAFASTGVLFQRAYCQQAVCSPSRTSVITGLRPDAAGVTDLTTHFRDQVPDVVTLPQHFRRSGYHCESIGKIMHKPHMQDDANSWSVASVRGKGSYWKSVSNVSLRNSLIKVAKAKGLDKQPGRAFYDATQGPPTDAADRPDEEYLDGDSTQKAIRSLAALSKSGQPFFLALGYVKPHLPFSAPKKYWDLYDRDSLPSPRQKLFPAGSATNGHANWGELRGYHGMPKKGPVTAEQQRELIHGYYACISHVDHQIGLVMNKLVELGLDKNTTVVIWSDHGWKLGDYGAWCKHTAYEIDTRVPLLIRSPGMTTGRKTNSLVELVDLYPTLCELAGLKKPAHLDGISLKPILDGSETSVKDAAFSQWPGKRDNMMGYSVRTADWRYTQWINKDSGKVVESELYDHHTRLDESKNVESQFPDHATKLAALIKENRQVSSQ